MAGTIQKPTLELYNYFQSAYEFFNDRLFDGELPQVTFTITRAKRVAGYFSADVWQDEQGNNYHEIAVNPAYFITSSPLELMQTLTHEAVHLHQHEYGTPSVRTYHNKEWSEKMQSIGLMPSSTGKPGGKKTGQKMADYPIPGGRFEKACRDFFTAGFKLALVDRTYASAITLQQLNEVIEARIELEETAEALSSTEVEEIAQVLDIDISALESSDDVVTVEQIIDLSLSAPLADFYDINKPDEENKPVSPSKTKYTCPVCSCNVWGKPNLAIMCKTCKVDYEQR